jgi:hypothetical protein
VFSIISTESLREAFFSSGTFEMGELGLSSLKFDKRPIFGDTFFYSG